MKIIKKAAVILIWLIIWQAASIVIRNEILFAGPIETVKSLIALCGESVFFNSVISSYLHIMAGIITGTLLGLFLSCLAYKYRFLDDFLSPAVLLMKAVPVASFVVLVLIWAGNRNLSTIISGIIVFPIIYTSVLTGLKNSDRSLLEMAYVYRMPIFNKIRYIFIPALFPIFKNAIALSIGMGFKSGVAAEVIGQPLMSMGNGIYNAKIYLNTGELFAWTLAIVVISWITEKIIGFVLSFFDRSKK